MKTKIHHLSSLFDIPVSFSEDKRQQRLLDIFLSLWGVGDLVIIGGAFFVWITGKAKYPEEAQQILIYSLLFIPCLITLFILNHSRAGRLARISFVGLLLLTVISDAPEQIAGGRSLAIFALPIIAAGILIRPSASFLLAFISSVIVEGIAFSIRPQPQPFLYIVVFFLLATIIWIATRSMEQHIKGLIKANNALKESEERYRALVEISPDMVVLTNLYGEIIVVNQAGLALFGFTSSSEVEGKKVFEFLIENDRQRAITEFGKMAENQSPVRVEYCAQTRQGTTFFIELNASVTRDANGMPQGVLSVGRDITLRKKMEQALLAEKDEAYRTLVDNSSQGMVLLQEGKIILANAAIANCIGLTVEELYLLPAYKIFDFVHPDDREIGFERMKERQEGKPVPAYYETRLVHKNGTIYWLELRPTIIMLDGVITTQITTIDITERKRAEEALREREKRYRDLFENASLAVFQSGISGQVIDVNPEFARMFGYQSPEEFKALVRDAALVFANPERRAEIIRLRTEDPTKNTFENIYRRKDGSTFIGQLTIKTILNECGQLQCFEGFIEDITSRKETEKALRQSEERYRSLAETAQDLIIILNTDDRIEYVNQLAARLTGMAAEEIIGQPRSRFFGADVNNRHLENLQKVIKDGQPVFTESRTPFRTGEIWLSNWMVPLKDENGVTKEILAISRDITKRIALEQSLTEANNLLEQRVAERTADLINSHEQLRRLTRRTVFTQENERRRLSRELHDEAGQALIGLTFSLDEILADIPEEMIDIREKIIKALARAKELHQHMRGMAHGLRPPILDVAGINLALQGFCREFSEETHFPVAYNGIDNLPALSDEISITLYRIVQEAITNVVKHAHATEAHVSLSYDAGCVTVTIMDNGAGFETTSTPKGVGLLGMEERLGLLGGSLEIASRRKHGTRLKAVIPVVSSSHKITP